MTGRNARRRRSLRLTVLVVAATMAIPLATGGAATAATTPIFAPAEVFPLGTDTAAVAIGDVTGDGRADVVATSSAGSPDYRVYVLAGLADGTLAAPVSYPTADSGRHRLPSVTVGDVTGDGLGDVVVAAGQVGIEVLAQQLDGTLGAPTVIATTDDLRVRTGNLDSQPGLDIAAIGWGTGTVSVFLNDGQGGLGAAVVYAVRHSGYDDLEIGDVVRDGRDDIVVMSGQLFAAPNISVLEQRSNGVFAAPAEYLVADQTNTNGIGVGDVTGDGRVDVVAAYGGNVPSARLAVLAQRTNGRLAAPISYPSYDIPTPVEVADVDRDGRGDVITLHAGWLQAGVYLGEASGTLGAEELYQLPSNGSYDPHGLAVGDVTGDGWPDIVIADPFAGVLMLRNYGGTPPPPTPTPTPTPSPSPTATPDPTPTPLPTPTPELPSAPQHLVADPNLAAGVGLQWIRPDSPGSGHVINFRIYRGPDGNAWAELATIGSQTNTYTDTTVPPGATFWYRVSAISEYGEGPPSDPVVAQRAQTPGAPTGMTAVSTKSGIAVSWTVPSDGGSEITGYRVYRGTASGGETFLFSVAANAIGFTDINVKHRFTYFYQVSAVNNIGEGPRSSEVSARGR
jgi:hypothetical protein